MRNFLRILRLAIALSLAVSTMLFVVWSRRWPLVGDASMIHYIVFMIEHGKAPYRDLVEMSMPGTFLIEMAAMKVFGDGATGWRVFDFTLLGVAAGAYFVLTKRAGWFAAGFAAGLFALVHGRDGLAQGGQRDLTMAVLLLAATAALLMAVRRRVRWEMVAFGLLAGVAATIKPTALPLSLAQLAIAAWAMRRAAGVETPPQTMRLSEMGHPRLVMWAFAGMAVGPLIAVGFVMHEHAAPAFWGSLTGLVPYFVTLGHRPLGYLLLHSISPLLALVLPWLAVLALVRPRLDWERGLLLCGVVFGLGSYLAQARGLPYYRYPLLAFLLPLMAVDFSDAMGLIGSANGRLKAGGALAVAALCVGGFWLGPQSAISIHRYRWWETDFSTSLQQNLTRLGGAKLSGQVQCIDSVSGCGTALYAMRLMPATGILLDFPLFGASNVAYVRNYRNQFRDGVFQHPPQVIVVSSWLFLDGVDEYKKLDRWPELEEFLAREYTLDTEWKPARTQRWWSREEWGPGYRIYVRKEARP